MFTTLALIFIAAGSAPSQEAKLPRGCVVELGGADLVHWNLLCAAISPDGRLTATGDEGTYANPQTQGDWIYGCVRVWDTTTGRLVREIRDAGLVQGLAFSADASLVAAIDGKGKANVRIWNVADGKLLHTVSAEGGIGNELVFSPDSRLLATGGDDYGVKILEIATGRIRDVPAEMRGRMQFTPDSKALWGLGDTILMRFSLADSRTDSCTVAHASAKLLDLAINPDGKSAATIDDARIVCIHDSRDLTLRETWRIEGHEELVPRIAWSAMGHEIITISDEGAVTTWSGDTRKPGLSKSWY